MSAAGAAAPPRDAGTPGNADLQRRFDELLAHRVHLERRYAELRGCLTQLAATALPAAAAAQLAAAIQALRQFDLDLSSLADALHALRAQLESRGELAAGSVQQVLFVRAGGQTLAVPLDQVQEIRALGHAGGLRVVDLAQRLGAPAMEGPLARLLVVAGEPLVAVAVSEVLRQDEVAVRPLSSYFSGMRFFSGAAVTAEGLVLVLDTRALV